MHVGQVPAQARHAGGRESHVSVDWLIRLMGCWHLSLRAVETSEAD